MEKTAEKQQEMLRVRAINSPATEQAQYAKQRQKWKLLAEPKERRRCAHTKHKKPDQALHAVHQLLLPKKSDSEFWNKRKRTFDPTKNFTGRGILSSGCKEEEKNDDDAGNKHSSFPMQICVCHYKCWAATTTSAAKTQQNHIQRG